MQKKYIVTKEWLKQVFLKSQDRRFLSGTIYDTIEPVVWEKFGPLKLPAKLCMDNSRNSLFEEMQFVSFEQDQVKRLASLVNLGGGKVTYHDLAIPYNIDIGQNTIFIAPSKERSRTMQRWQLLKEDIDEK